MNFSKISLYSAKKTSPKSKAEKLEFLALSDLNYVAAGGPNPISQDLETPPCPDGKLCSRLPE